MMNKSPESILFPEDLIYWEDFIRLVVHLRIPFRHRSTGIDCITGGLMEFKLPSSVNFWPIVLRVEHWKFINDHLEILPYLEYPISTKLAKEFIDQFVMLKDSPGWVPLLLTHANLLSDIEKRNIAFESEKNELKRLMSSGDIFLVDSQGMKCEHLSSDVFLSNREAIRLLERKGLIDRALMVGCHWKAFTCEPYVDNVEDTADKYHGLSQELLKIGIAEYRSRLTLSALQGLTTHLEASGSEQDLKETVTRSQTYERNDVSASLREINPDMTDKSHGEAQTSSSLSESNSKDIESSDTDGCLEVKDSADGHSIDKRDSAAPTPKWIKMKKVLEMLQVSRATLYNYINPQSKSYDPTFPVPQKMTSENRWYESEIIDWMKKKKK
ncbi:MAG: AlpA family phage regulatory protein [Methylicorpusculum sp.]|uniref:helix-turn-helix transcriptional regulator n=1 Tax=Methylicorpusculum sp. TaxID=2713644 RepID=UPI0027217B0C|nr:AlpA family phage regulatory protein [Methylicorpusculum sp.]MDO8940617.1 AlpA family phage regulatory protein [Methylicorpusculum sp.]